MSGPRPVHLERRGAVYAVRFKIPARLRAQLDLSEIRRSLFTKDIDVARARCLDASLWFTELMRQCSLMPEYTKADIERRVRDYFSSWSRWVETAMRHDVEERGVATWTKRNIIAADRIISDCDNELRTGIYGEGVMGAAEGLIREAPAFEELSKQLLSRAMRQAFRYWKHRMETPALPFTPDDPFFDFEGSPFRDEPIARPDAGVFEAQRPPTPSNQAEPFGPHSPQRDEGHCPTLSQIVEMYVDHLREKGAGASHRNEIARALAWLEEELGHATRAAEITTADIRAFRNNLIRLNATGRGKSLPFRDRLTDIREQQITHATASKYWGAIKGMFAWALSEGICDHDPTAKLRLERPIGEEANSPEAYSMEELIRFYQTPLYTGYKSDGRTRQEGDCRQRGQHWWAGVLPLFTGMRAGELSQLLPSDFFFDAPIPYLQITRFDHDGVETKRTKTPSSVRRVPIAPPLLELGLKQFVERRKKVEPKARVFQRFRMGTETDGKLSEGMVSFWGAYVRHYGLHKKGRGTHVWRHTVVDFLTRLGAIEEDVAGYVGHERGSQTSRYGRQKKEGMPLERLKPLADSLEFGFDLVSMLGGPYRDDIHRA